MIKRNVWEGKFSSFSIGLHIQIDSTDSIEKGVKMTTPRPNFGGARGFILFHPLIFFRFRRFLILENV